MQTPIDSSWGTRSPTVNYAPIDLARPIDDVAMSKFILQRQSIIRFVRDELQSAVVKQKENADKHGRKTSKFRKGGRVLLSTESQRDSAVTNVGTNELAPRLISHNVFEGIGDR